MELDAERLIEYVSSHIYGRLCHEHRNCNFLLWAIKESGNGDHLEIGTLHGGSAILVALAKKALGLEGEVWCIDPLDGYYKGTTYECPVDFVTQVPVTPEVLLENLEVFGVTELVHIVQAKSVPFPDELALHEFASTYIDGDHWGQTPYNDWLNASMRTRRMVVFDNVDEKHPDVLSAVERAAQTDEWQVALRTGITAVLERK